MSDFPRLEKTVFVITYGRSGSTLLQNMLNSLPGYLIRGENENLLAPLARAWDMLARSPQASKIRAEARTTGPQHPWFGYEAVSAPDIGQALADSFLRTVLRPEETTRVAGFKEIRWHSDPALFPVMLDFLHRFFPDARFVINIRDHDQVVRSGWWKHMRQDNVRALLTRAEALYAEYAAAHPDRCITMVYSRYTAGVDAWRPLFDFLDEPFNPALVRAVLDKKLQHLQNV